VVGELRQQGFKQEDISIVATKCGRSLHHRRGKAMHATMSDTGAAQPVAQRRVASLAALPVLIVGLMGLAIPGIGPDRRSRSVGRNACRCGGWRGGR